MVAGVLSTRGRYTKKTVRPNRARGGCSHSNGARRTVPAGSAVQRQRTKLRSENAEVRRFERVVQGSGDSQSHPCLLYIQFKQLGRRSCRAHRTIGSSSMPASHIVARRAQPAPHAGVHLEADKVSQDGFFPCRFALFSHGEDGPLRRDLFESAVRATLHHRAKIQIPTVPGGVPALPTGNRSTGAAMYIEGLSRQTCDDDRS